MLSTTIRPLARAVRDEVLGARPAFLLPPRRFHAYCIGTAKSGTHSIASVFEGTYRSAHEPDALGLLAHVKDAVSQPNGEQRLRHYVRVTDRRLWLEMNSSHVNYHILPYLLEQAPDARYVLTIRDCFSWLESTLNQHVARSSSLPWHWLREYRFGRGGAPHPIQERALERRSLFTLDGYFSYWAKQNEDVLRDVPPDRLLVIRTKEIGTSLDALASFVGVPASTLDSRKSHSFKTERSEIITSALAEIDPQYLCAKAEQYCAPLMERFFPDVWARRDQPRAAPVRG